MWLQTGREGVAPMRLEVSLIAFYCGSCDPGEGIPRQQKLPQQSQSREQSEGIALLQLRV